MDVHVQPNGSQSLTKSQQCQRIPQHHITSDLTVIGLLLYWLIYGQTQELYMSLSINPGFKDLFSLPKIKNFLRFLVTLNLAAYV